MYFWMPYIDCLLSTLFEMRLAILKIHHLHINLEKSCWETTRFLCLNHIWATAYIRGKFFAGFKTTSRCEGLHLIVARYVRLRYNLTSFVEYFQWCIVHLHFKEFNVDYKSTRGMPVMQTCVVLLERFAAEVYTHES
ncbi:hypothetical protein Ahy_B01g053101 isoform B [Arachis hypogaea]|uniref:Protein FAR1-RELATED SEQUENCE n=1 Tax=Arachis hypogaea TaxID=3818 RepID=A0A445AR25_ARAHY|nr:hypothetical protein Ahy_B01g053101 isoform B [Arachis hypogaea]